MSPVYPPEMVADAIVRLALRPRRQVVVGTAGRLLGLQHALAPGLTERMLAGLVERDHLRDRPAPPSPGNVLEPMPGWTGVHGGWGAGAQAANGGGGTPAVLGGLLLAGAALGYYAWRRQREQGRHEGDDDHRFHLDRRSLHRTRRTHRPGPSRGLERGYVHEGYEPG
ncbi:MAG TPA: hypothetical protein VFG47_02010 [Geminicoccaceae bacterium]|nr:hypothetical protein [Geminicoccaceae bacterium]